ncbi:7-deoxyloganetic acid glucosyltransferase-like [Nicotiana tabacum]|uniref:Glycosyltransferase n=2 Tax=Nicotiana TaxID=4085 RepID=A0A1S4BMJ5_TOBAC|nr:PREDICTED: 7-deoxyloganetic acid glucosyltransferase-like [Nicotiana sylvestris]XP_016490079.1 PREDICTED: 7-deoxyloganetic acid glucosyltransferase-like [Nicotiana tabacum]WIW42903.1 UDP-glycosyltransferase [Nicotiana tabacum]
MALPHVLIFPLPIQGPVNCMLKLAELFCLHHQEIHVTFLNSEHIQQRLLNCTDVQIRFKKYPNFKFMTIPDGLAEDNPRTGDQVRNLVKGVEDVSSPLLREMVTSGLLSPNSEKPVTCLLVDGIVTFAVDIAKEVGIPLLYFDTISPCALWTCLCVPKLIEAGEIPFKGNDLDALVNNVPGMEGVIRRRDLPSFCRAPDLNNPTIQRIVKEGKHIVQAQGLIFNTFEGLEGPILPQFRTLCPNIYSIGPLHIHLKKSLSSKCSVPKTSTSNSIWKEDMSCMDWLDEQPNKSVLFVSIGSVATMSKAQLLEIWYGLVNSKTRFLWVQRPGSVIGLEENNDIPMELSKYTKERGCIVSWAPQEEVLAHPSIGGFLTHCGWNSTLESIVEGVPMICWPYFVDQQVNSRYVGEVWKLGLDMKDVCDRAIVEKMVREIMEVRKIEFLERGREMRKLAIESVNEGGSSYKDLDSLVEDIRLMRI